MKTLLISLSIFLLPFIGNKVDQKKVVTLRVRIVEINEKSGNIRLGLYNNEESWLETGAEYIMRIVKVTSTELVVTYPELPVGEYGISIYHDANTNGEIDKNFFGVPKEGYGFSRDAKVFLRAPKFENSAFQLTNDTTITITMTY